MKLACFDHFPLELTESRYVGQVPIVGKTREAAALEALNLRASLSQKSREEGSKRWGNECLLGSY